MRGGALKAPVISAATVENGLANRMASATWEAMTGPTLKWGP